MRDAGISVFPFTNPLEGPATPPNASENAGTTFWTPAFAGVTALWTRRCGALPEVRRTSARRD